MKFISKSSFTATFIIFLSIINLTHAQETTPKDWHLLDEAKDNYPGISLKKAYDLLKSNNKQSSPVIVAVLDSGLDINHEDIRPILWKNTKEIAGNNLDDDGNGYIDDVHGWNFIGGQNGESVEAETLESTRFYRKYKEQFKDKNKFTIQKSEQDDYEKYLAFMKKFDEGVDKLEKSIKSNQEEYEFFNKLIPPLQKAVGKKSFTEKELRKTRIRDNSTDNLRSNFFRIIERNSAKNLTSVKLIKHYEELSSKMETLQTRLAFNYSLDFDGRSIVGDQPNDMNEKIYGNNDVTKRAEHGTHVSGIIGAVRNNKIGINGIADNVVIMPIRNTPMGDEKDKDVANGIRYAVDNGAKIINMSFGKDYSPNKKVVDNAVLYAKKKGVLLIHAAGNDNKNTDYFYNYPSPLLEDSSIASNWIEVGASGYEVNEKLVANFSNYGKYGIDIFAPGVDIYATLPENKYDTRSGTSMAAPVVSGVAALLLSYFPELTPEQIIEIITASGTLYTINVTQPGTDKKVPFTSLSKHGKIINAYSAVKLALEKYNN